MKKRIIAIVTSLSVAAMIVGPAPVQAVTTAELQAQINALLAQLATLQTQLADLGGTGTVTACSITSFDRALKLGMSGDDVKCLQVVLNSAADTQLAASGVGSSGNETSYFGPLTKAGVVKFQEKYASEVLASWGLTAGTGFVGSTTRTKLNSLLSTGGNGVIPIIPTGAGLTVTLAVDTPAVSTLVSGATTGQSVAPLAKFTFTNGDNAEVKITKLKLKRLGVSADATLTNVYLFENAVRLTDAASVSSGVITFTETTGIIKIPAGGSKTITVKADIATASSGQTLGIGVNAAADVTANASAINGTFPINGNLMNTASGTLAGVNFVGTPTPSGGTIDPQDDYIVWQSSVVVTTRAVSFTRISFREIGTVTYSALENFRLYIGGTQVGSAVQSLDDNGYVTFDLSAEPEKMETGTRVVKLMADIISGSNRTFSFSLRVAADANFVDSQYGVSILPQAGGSAFSARTNCGSTCTISYGIITVAKKADSPNDVIDGTSAETLAEFEIKAAGERVKIETLEVQVIWVDEGGDDTGEVASLRNCMLLANGVQIGSTKTIAVVTTASSTGTSFPLGSSLIVEPGSPVTFAVIADIYDNDGVGEDSDLEADDTLQVNLIAGATNAQGMVSLTTSDVPTAAKTGNAVTIESGDVTMAKYTAYPDKTLVAPLTAAKLAHFTLTAKHEVLNMDTIVVNLETVTGGVDASDDLSNLYVTYGANTTSVKPTPVDGDNTWSVNYELAKHDVIDLIVYADVASTAYVGVEDTITPTITISGVAAESANAVDKGPKIGQTITFSVGTLTAQAAGDTPLAQIVSGSTAADIAAATPKQVTAAKFKFTAANDDFTIDWLKVEVGAVPVSGAILYAVLKDGTTVLDTKPFDLSTNTKAKLRYDVDVPANTSKTLTIDLMLAQPSADVSTSQVDVKITLDEMKYTNSQGVETSDDSPEEATSTSDLGGDPAGKAMYVYQSVPTITQVDLTNSVLYNGSSTKLYSFKIAADSKGSVSIKQLRFDLAWTDLSLDGNELSTFKFKRGSTDITSLTSIVDSGGNDITGSTAVTTADTDGAVIVNFTTEETIPAGGTRTYNLYATPALFTAKASIVGADAVSLYLAGGDSAAAGNKYLVDEAATGIFQLNSSGSGDGTTYDLTWSDNSSIGHSYAANNDYPDWSNGYLVLNLPLDAETWSGP